MILNMPKCIFKMNEHFWNVGYSHATSTDIDPVGEGIDAFPCTLSESANAAYADGYVTGMSGSNPIAGVSSGEGYSHSSYPESSTYEYGRDQKSKSQSHKNKTNIELLNDFNAYLKKNINTEIHSIKISSVKIGGNHARDGIETTSTYNFIFKVNGNFSPRLNCHILYGDSNSYKAKTDKWVISDENAKRLCRLFCGSETTLEYPLSLYENMKNVIKRWLE